MGFADQEASGYPGDPLQRGHWISQMVEHPEKQDQVELSYFVDIELVDVEAPVLDAVKGWYDAS